jgi:hypothetical protein
LRSSRVGLLDRLLQDRVLHQLLLDLLHQLQLRHLQELDGLLERGGHDEPLAHPDAEFLLEGHRSSLLPTQCRRKFSPRYNPADVRVGGELQGRAVPEDAALADNIGAVRDLQSFADLWSVMSTPRPSPPQLGHHLLQVGHGDGIDAGEGLVQQHVARLAGERARDLRTPALPAGEGVALGPGHGAQAEVLRRVARPALHLRAPQPPRLQDRLQVLRHGHAAEDGGLLGEVPDAAPRPHVHGQGGDVARVQQDAPLVGGDEARG